MRNENWLPRARTIGPSGAESRVHTPATYRHYCRHYQIGHLHAPSWFRTRSPSSPPTAFSHIILGQLLGIPSSSADVTGSIWAEVVQGDERGSPGFGRSSAAISEIAAAAAFLSSQPAVGLLINVSFALNIRPCTQTTLAFRCRWSTKGRIQ